VQTTFLCSILKDDYELTARHTAQEGLQAAREGGWSLILLDVVMPGMDGFQLIQALKADEAIRYVPVILITSLADVQYEERGLVLGAVDYVTKPFNPAIIKARVNTHVQLYRYRTRFMQQAMVDGLTGVSNRRSYEERSIARWREAVRFGLPFSVCMFDIDKFKVYNDTFGHPAGDKVLSAVAQKISSHLHRATDFFARYGGEEFVAIILGSSAADAFEHMRGIRRAVEELRIPHNETVSPWVTVSLGGVTLFPGPKDSYDTHLKIADTMLYDAKRFGRNQVVWYSDKMELWREHK